MHKAKRCNIMHISSSHTANMFATHFLAEVQAVQASVLPALEQIPDKDNSPPKQVVNSAFIESTQLAILKLLESIEVEKKTSMKKIIYCKYYT